MEAPLNIIIADDESLARDTVRLLLEDVKDVEVAGKKPQTGASGWRCYPRVRT